MESAFARDMPTVLSAGRAAAPVVVSFFVCSQSSASFSSALV